MKRRLPVWPFALLIIAGFVTAQGYQPNFPRNLVGPISVTGNLTVSGTTSLQAVTATTVGVTTSISNAGTSAACSSNTGAVCVNDANGEAWANGSGTTVATMSNAGKLSISTLAVTATTDLNDGTLDGVGTATVTVRSAAKCFCWNSTTGGTLICTLSGTTLSISGGSASDGYYFFCLTKS